jgi:hypothetical protein
MCCVTVTAHVYCPSGSAMQALVHLASQALHFFEFWTSAEGLDNSREVPNTLPEHNFLMFFQNRKCVVN